MAKCVDCGKETNNTVWEPNIFEKVPLCESCRDNNYAKCEVCGQYYPLEEMNAEHTMCHTCEENNS